MAGIANTMSMGEIGGTVGVSAGAGAGAGAVGLTGLQWLGVAGLATSLLGNILENERQADEARISAAWLDAQAAHFRNVTNRQKFLVGQQIQGIKAERSVVTAGNGIELTGSYLDMQDQVDYLGSLEIAAVEEQGAMDIREAHMKAEGLRRQADELTSFSHQFMSSMGALVGSPVTASLMSQNTGNKGPGFLAGASGDLFRAGRAIESGFRSITPGRSHHFTAFRFKSNHSKGIPTGKKTLLRID